MLAKRRGAKGAKSKMAKKAVPAALQIDVTNDEEWEKILQEKKGLIVADVYSDWSGPCIGMVSILKKLKMELGGDILSYVTARCDKISSLERFRGRCEPIWMFICDGQMVNLMFGANCPEFVKLLTLELSRVQKGEPHNFSIPVAQLSPEEEKRNKIEEEIRIAKEEAKRIKRESEVKARYESEMQHLMDSLRDETCLLLYPWVFRDEEGHRRDKKSSPAYVDLIENILAENYIINQETRKALKEDILQEMFKESDYKIPDQAKELILDGKCLFMRIKIHETKKEMDVERYLLTLLFGKVELVDTKSELVEGSFAEKHQPVYVPTTKEPCSYFPIAWAPLNPRNKAMAFRTIFRKYVETNFPYEDKTAKAPVILFKYDATRKNELKMVLEMYSSEVTNFGVFDRDKPPDSKLIATSIEEFEEMTEPKTSYETFVCVVKKIGCEAFLAFAGIGPYHVSENPEKAIEETDIYFPDINLMEEEDDEDKPEQIDGNPEEENVVPENPNQD